MIETIYKVEVEVDEYLYDEYCNVSEYTQMIMKCTALAIESGCHYYGTPTEWATFNDLSLAKDCERKLINAVNFFKRKYEIEFNLTKKRN